MRNETAPLLPPLSPRRSAVVTMHGVYPYSDSTTSVVKRTMGRLIGYSNGNTRLEKQRPGK